MIYNQISSDVCIARVFDRFNIEYSGFIARVPNWIFQAMGELDIYQAFSDYKVSATIESYKVQIPLQTKEIMAVEYDGLRLRRIDAINNIEGNQTLLYHPVGTYQISNGYIITSFEEGEIIFYIKAFPVVLNTNLNLYFPSIPNNEDVLIALDWYMLKRLLERGHIVYGYSLKENNEFTNPALAWEKWKKIARNSVIHIDSDERSAISNMLKTFIQNYNFRNNQEFNHNKII